MWSDMYFFDYGYFTEILTFLNGDSETFTLSNCVVNVFTKENSACLKERKAQPFEYPSHSSQRLTVFPDKINSGTSDNTANKPGDNWVLISMLQLAFGQSSLLSLQGE